MSEAAALLGVSDARVRQRIENGSLVAERIGGRWLVDLRSASADIPPARGRPVSPRSVWCSLLALDAASLLDLPREDVPDGDPDWPEMVAEVRKISPSSRRRAISVLASAIAHADHAELLSWLRNRGERRLYIASEADLASLRADARFRSSGVSHPDSDMSDPRVAEGYLAHSDLADIVRDHWLDPVSVGERPNVVLHAVPVLPRRISRLLLAADLAEHGGPRELLRAHQLLDDAIAEQRNQP